MKLAAQRPEGLLEILCRQIELARKAQEGEVVAVPAERENLRALRTEMNVHGSAAAAAAADLKRRRGGLGRHVSGGVESGKERDASGRLPSFRCGLRLRRSCHN